jgi:hypothetical protein
MQELFSDFSVPLRALAKSVQELELLELLAR